MVAMNELSIIAASSVTAADLPTATHLGKRFGRLDLQSQLSLLAVAALKDNFANFAPDRVGIIFAASAGSLSTDVNFWEGRNGVGGPSPTLFAYTLPSAAVGEIAIHFKLTGPDLCFVGDGKNLFSEARDLIERGEADAVVCIFCDAVTTGCGKIILTAPIAAAQAVFIARGKGINKLREFDRDTNAFRALISSAKSADY
jgi:3-oxoacyl-(acyl-carrier-protein) synthase